MALLKDCLILVVNSGSSSLKLTLFKEGPDSLTFLAAVLAEELGSPNAGLSYKASDGRCFEKKLGTFPKADRLKQLLDLLVLEDPRFDPKKLAAVGHRVVHGGSYTQSMPIHSEVLQTLEKLIPLAPLHNPAAIEAIKSAISITPKQTLQVAVFDTAFHRHLPPAARYYGLPHSLTERHQIQRYGFHGIAHEALWNIYAEKIAPQKQPPRKIVTLHLGNGCSMSAICEGICQETSMGYTPAEGLLMGTRAGNIDAGAIEALCRLEHRSIQEILYLLNHQSGLLGVSEISSDFRELFEHKTSSAKAKLALDLFCHRVRLYLGGYIAILGGVDAILFSGGIGENSAWMRQEVLKSMQWCGVDLNEDKNNAACKLSPGQICKLHQERSSIELYAVGADENRAIAKQVQLLMKKNGK